MEIDANYWCNEVEKLMSPHKSPDRIMMEIIPLAKELAKKMEVKSEPPCKVYYDPTLSPEMFIWALGVVCECWTLEILRRKMQHGHCYAHATPCGKGSQFHQKFYDEVKGSFEQVIRQTNR